MNCDLARRAISAAADVESASDRAELDAERRLSDHLVRCSDCRKFQGAIERIRTDLRLGDASSTIDVSGRVLDELDRSGSSHRTADRRSGARPFQALVAALILVVAVGSAFVVGWRSRPLVVDAGDRQPQTHAAEVTTSVGTAPAVDGVEPSAPTDRLAVVWTPGGLQPNLMATIAEQPELEYAVVRRATIDLTSSTTEDGRPIDYLAPRWVIPIDAISFDPDRYAVVMPSPAVVGLEPGMALVSETSAALRRVEPGDRLHFGALSLMVAAVVPDAVVGGAELAVDRATGERLGLWSDRYALLRFSGDSPTLAATIRASADGPVRFRTEDQVRFLRNNDGLLPQAEIKSIFGEFSLRRDGNGFDVDPTWFDEHIVSVELPLIGELTCHRILIPILETVLSTMAADGSAALADEDDFLGCFNPRAVGQTMDPSRHAWGAAVDFGDASAAPETTLVSSLQQQGLAWGGNWLVPDGGHFEYTSPPTDPTN